MNGSGLLLVHAGATWFMVGLIWFVQVVHYPLFTAVDDAGFSGFEARHQRLTTLVVLPPMLVELATAALLVVLPPPGTSRFLTTTGLALALAIWASTFLLQMPCHTRLARAFDAGVHRRLVRTNFVRTALWSARGVLALALIGA